MDSIIETPISLFRSLLKETGFVAFINDSFEVIIILVKKFLTSSSRLLHFFKVFQL